MPGPLTRRRSCHRTFWLSPAVTAPVRIVASLAGPAEEESCFHTIRRLPREDADALAVPGGLERAAEEHSAATIHSAAISGLRSSCVPAATFLGIKSLIEQR